MNRMIAAASAAVLSLAAGAAVAQDFRALAQQDLQAAHDALAANHPAAVIPGASSQAFRSWIDAGLAEAKSKVGQVNSGDSHAYLMRYYATASAIRTSPSAPPTRVLVRSSPPAGRA